jgi:hypothetical protein
MSTWIPQYDEDLVQDSSWLPENTAITSYSFYKDTPEGEVVLYYDDAAHLYYRYDADGNRVDVPGVTTVLQIIDKSKPLMRWAVKLAIATIREGLEDGRKQLSTEEFMALLEDAKTKHEQELKEAGDVGHVVHGHLENMIKLAIETNNGIIAPLQGIEITDERVTNSIGAALEWCRSHKVRFIFTERKCYSRTFDVAGTGDGLALVSSCDDPLCCPTQYVDHLSFVDWKTSRSMRSTYPVQVAIYQFAYIEETNEPVTDRWILKLDKETGKLKALYCPPETFADDLDCFLAALELYRIFNKIEDRRGEESKRHTEAVRARKRAFKEAAEEQEKARKADARAALKAAKEDWDQKRKTFYKALRDKKVSKVDAELQTETAFPKANRPGTKEESEPVQADSAVPTQANVAEPLPVATAPVSAPVVPKGQWKWKP